MKNLAIIKNSMLVALAVTGMNMMTSCESCSRKEGDGHDDDMAATHDTVYIDTCMTPKDTLVRDGASGMYVPKGQRPAGSGGGKAGTAGTGTASAGTAKNTLTQEEIDDRVENSSSQATKNGKPINSGGTSGTGTGTGTGSTGNNSKVTTKKDQLKN